MPVIDKTDRTLQDVLDRIIPTEKEQVRTQELVNTVVSATKQAIRGKGLDHVIAGSFTRDTWMKDKREFDIFIRFPAKTTREKLEKMGLDFGKQIAKLLHGRPTVAYAEHPYTRVKVKDYDVDVVPCYKLPSALRIKSAVDRTPFHNEWLSHHFLPKLSPEVRLLKQFCKGQGIYGSDTRTQGFSGYLCELLIIKYKTFKNLARKSQDWKAGKILINLEGMYPITDVRNVHRKFPRQPLIMIDPVDPGRNVAAALSPENFIRFIRACREFWKRPSTDFFFIKPPAPNISKLERELSSRKTTLIGFSTSAPKVIEDVLWPQLRRTMRRVSDVLQDNDFNVHDSTVWSDGKTCLFLFELETSSLPRIRKLRGPSVFAETNSKNFLRKYRPSARVWVEDEFWMAEVPRTFRSSTDLLEATLSGKESQLKSSGIASYLAREIPRSKKMMSRSDIMSLARREKVFGQFLQDHLEKNLS